ncbi:hypothetical protein H8E88_00515 [candidate division KSB1 bacterium]|nr:hypothetical protein [candidate division KSB1 bacterium]
MTKQGTPYIKKSGNEYRCSECDGLVKIDSKNCWKCKSEFINEEPNINLGNPLYSYGVGKKIIIYEKGYEYLPEQGNRHLWTELSTVKYLWNRKLFNFTLFTGRFYLHFIFKDGDYSKIGFPYISLFTDIFLKKKIEGLLTTIQFITEKYGIDFIED